jgi:hypothetical protein
VSDREVKQCPDCGEMVLEVARKCRYCGYRFDEGAPADGRTWLSDLMGFLRPVRKTETRWSLVAKWGTLLAPGERIDRMLAAQVGARRGYLVMTRERLMFFEQVAQHKHRLTVELPLQSIREVHVKRGMGRSLTVRGVDNDVVVRGLNPRVLDDLRTYLSEHAVADHAGLGSGDGSIY